jgi:hypothetical protein
MVTNTGHERPWKRQHGFRKPPASSKKQPTGNVRPDATSRFETRRRIKGDNKMWLHELTVALGVECWSPSQLAF